MRINTDEEWRMGCLRIVNTLKTLCRYLTLCLICMCKPTTKGIQSNGNHCLVYNKRNKVDGVRLRTNRSVWTEDCETDERKKRKYSTNAIVAMKLFLNLFIVQIYGCQRKEEKKIVPSIDFNCIPNIISSSSFVWSLSWMNSLKFNNMIVLFLVAAVATFICWSYN